MDSKLKSRTWLLNYMVKKCYSVREKKKKALRDGNVLKNIHPSQVNK